MEEEGGGGAGGKKEGADSRRQNRYEQNKQPEKCGLNDRPEKEGETNQQQDITRVPDM